jgi:hypothetical protein
MALFGSSRDMSLFRKINRELLGDIITQQVAFYKYQIERTNINIYGESAEEKYFVGPTLLNCLIERANQEYIPSDININFEWAITFKFLRDDLVDINLVPEVGDILLYQESYYEVHNIVANQYFVGKNPQYPNAPNPLDSHLANFGYNTSIICSAHIVPADKLGIERARYL